MLFRSADSALVRLLVLMMRPRVSMISRFSSRSSSSNSSIIGVPAEVAHIPDKGQARGASSTSKLDGMKIGRVFRLHQIVAEAHDDDALAFDEANDTRVEVERSEGTYELAIGVFRKEAPRSAAP